MSETEKAIQDEQTLLQLFTKGWELFLQIEDSSEPSNSESYQKNVKSCIETFIRCTHMVNILALFSSNEHINELSTDTLSFLLLPAFLGELSLKLMSNDRKTPVTHALTYFKSFLKHCNDYKISEKDLSVYIETEDLSEDLKNKMKMDNTRNKTREEKIKRFQETKELEKVIKTIQDRLKKEPAAVDESDVRNHYINWLKLWINKSAENIGSIKSELEILEHMEKLRQGKVQPAPPKEIKPFKPILITRDMIKNQVFGAGYKSLPTMTEDEYFEKEVREGKIVLDYDSKKNKESKDEDEDEKSDKDDSGDDEEKLKKARKWDEYKDTTRRGDGNKERNG